MEVFETTPQIEVTHPAIKPSPIVAQKDFKPTGAVAFFVVLVALGLIIWFGIYFLMLKRN